MKIRKVIALLLSAAFMIISAPEISALDSDKVEPWERSAETHRENLGSSIAYLEAFDTSEYTEESVTALKEAIKTAKAQYEDSTQPAKYYYSARNQLEYARAKLVYNTVGEDGPNKLPFRELSAEEVIEEMGAGINFGNTMDGHSAMVPSETAWQPRVAAKEQITSMHDGGYNTIRIPVTWGKKVSFDEETGEYSIDSAWLDRVNEVVDYAIDNGMYVIINIHHDGVNWSRGWFNIGKNDIDSVMEKYAAVWRIIAERFKDYDEHLIFESMNEMTCAQKDENKWSGGAFEYDVDIIRNFNQLFVNTVRSTGSNNTKRWLASKGHFAYTGRIEMPEDPLNEGVSHQMYSAHIYNSVENRYKGIKELADNYKDLGCPLILGEWTTYTGNDGSTATGYNDVEKAFQSELVYKYAKVNDICAVAWDIGVFTKDGRVEGGNASYWSREDLKPGFQSQLRGVMRGAYLPLTEENLSGNLENVYEQYGLSSANGVDQHPKTVTETKITAISCEDSAEMTVGEIITINPEVTPGGTNDLLVWTTDNDRVAVVSNGRITAKSAGTATITAYALNTVEYGYYGNYNANPYENAVKKEIKITVKNSADSFAVSGSDSLELTEGSSALLDLSCGGALTYISDNEEVATVNSVGRVFGKSAGTAEITATAPNGEKKTVKITVNEEFDEEREYINVGIFVLYNDAAHGYWENEIGEIVKIEENGTYTLTYDIAKHQSEDAKSLGIDTINNLTAIYLKDVDVHSGAIPESAFRHCRLKWEKVEINGQEMKLSEDRKIMLNPINKSGVFDSGSP
ncbi:MAG: cellulase family glycosylhydrolase, partial [Ruminiclostridium sp.]